MTSKVIVALSGGIDSLATALYMKDEGYAVSGLHFLTGYETHRRENIIETADQIGIDVDFIDIKKTFEDKVISYFTESFAKGLTPNPCLYCNPEIKFGLILDEALKMGADFLATGHYARIEKKDERYHLLKGTDTFKDQSYFLSFIKQETLSKIKFPLGSLTKELIKDDMGKRGFKAVTEGESQDVCFINEKDYKTFFENRGLIKGSSGNIVNISGEKIGEHGGFHNFTIGQRKGLNCPAKEPYYVTKIDPERNEITVGFKDKAFKNECTLKNVHWINKPDSLEGIKVALRYKHKEAESKLIELKDARMKIIFKEPQFSVTPGQGAVFYKDDEVLGAGWIIK
ncbi:MAG: tRNA 2-thiouridine(34) synthase MnmA [Desulfobacterales bacterium]|nr:tRNA 2-thiouridine(34) synthase MnmA [Desulfobacterales bacterium]